MKSETAVLLLAHGTPEKLEDIPAYLENVTAGRQLPEEVIKEIRRRYAMIGHSPLTEITMAQASSLQHELGMPVYVGMRNWRPFIGQTVQQMLGDGVRRAVVVCMAPQNSRTSVGLYKQKVLAESAGRMKLSFIESWHDHPRLIEAFARKLLNALEEAVEDWGGDIAVLFTAHSVPARTVTASAEGAADPYAEQAQRTAELVAERAGLKTGSWWFAFQSQGISGGPWLGPTVEETLERLKQQGKRYVMVQPVGFLCDHVEIFYDIDIGFRDYANDRGMHLRRTESLNDDPELTAALAELVRSALSRPGEELA
jgi:ferrochelatase